MSAVSPLAPPLIPPVAYTVAEFCHAHRISRSGLYQLWKQGQGPKFRRIGTKILISAESAREWRAGGGEPASVDPAAA